VLPPASTKVFISSYSPTIIRLHIQLEMPCKLHSVLILIEDDVVMLSGIIKGRNVVEDKANGTRLVR